MLIFFLLVCLNVFTDRKKAAKFLAEAFRSLGQREWHISENGVAVLLGIGHDVESDRSGAVRLAFEMSYMPFLCVLTFHTCVTN